MSTRLRRAPFRVVTLRVILGIGVGLTAGGSSVGCAAKVPARFDTRIHPAEDVKANANQVRLKMRSLVDPLCGELERTADQIAADSPDPAVRRAAVQWKIEAVPALREALFQPNPFVALSDAWVLFLQMADFFETGPGKRALGDSAGLAVEACRRLEQEMAEVAASTTASGDVSGVRAVATKWAAEHPIRGSIQARESTLGRALERDYSESASWGEAAVWIAVSLDDLNRRLEVYSSQLPRQVAWEAGAVGSDLRLADTIPLAERAVQTAEKVAATLDRVAPQIERTLSVADGAPALVAAERRAALDAFGAELTRTMTFLHGERSTSFEQVTAERVAFLAEMRKAVAEERVALHHDFDQMSRDLVDRAFWRFAQLVTATLASLVVIAIAGLFLVRKLFFPAPAR
jgi:hypothetical protein